MYLYHFTRHDSPMNTVTETASIASDLDAVDIARDFADIWGTPIEVLLESGHKVTVTPKAE